GNRIENAPQQIHRTGLKYKSGSWDIDVRYSYTSSVYTDALNTEQASENGQIGKIAGYGLMDASVHYAINPRWFAEVFVNNITDVRYATRRSTGYPGPGLLPGMGRSVNVTLGLKI
ncbi:MAG: TonB-dependent receptor domain-containing protein, partial [Flavobacteriales bacterium]